MKGDFTRATFVAQKHYSRVLFQLGRVTLDADLNEQTEILLHCTLARDLIGPHAGPPQNLGFEVSVHDGRVQIGAGRYYVDGILAEIDAPRFYDEQPHFGLPADDPLAGDNGDRLEGRTLRFYLDVWERHIAAIDDDHVRESALNGPDTATRSQVVWQVRALEVGANEGVDDNGNRVCSLAGMPGSLVQLIKVEGDHLIIGEASYPQPAELAFSATWRHPRVRRWDQVSKGDLVLKDGAVPVVEATATEAGWIDLEDGVQVRFEGGDGRVYRSGDYWQIPARVATGAIEWPSAQGAADQPAFQRPFDIEHHYAPLGFLSWNQDGAFAQDCRRRLLPIDSCSRPRASTRLAMRRCWRSARRARLSRLPATRRRRATLPELRGVRRSDERAGGCGGAVADGAPDGLLQRGVCGHQP